NCSPSARCSTPPCFRTNAAAIRRMAASRAPLSALPPTTSTAPPARPISTISSMRPGTILPIATRSRRCNRLWFQETGAREDGLPPPRLVIFGSKADCGAPTDPWRQFMKLESIALHHGYESEATTKAAAVPIYQTTSYTFDDTQHGADLFDLKVAGNIYTRIMNPTTAVLEARVAEMEGGIAALALASGMSAITYAIQTIAQAGDNIVAVSQLYGGTYNLFVHTFP